MKKVIKLKRNRKKKRTGLGITAIMVFLICGIVIYNRQELSKTNAQTEAQITELKKDIKDAKEEAKDIKKKKAYVQTQKFIEEMAREKLGLVYKDEIIFKSED
jgi:cell division protein DivIC